RMLKRACSVAYEALFHRILDEVKKLKVSKVVLSVPGTFSQLPFEAFLSADGTFVFDNMEVAVNYCPSVRLGADLVAKKGLWKKDLGEARVLVIGYEGDDMPKQHEEIGGG